MERIPSRWPRPVWHPPWKNYRVREIYCIHVLCFSNSTCRKFLFAYLRLWFLLIFYNCIGMWWCPWWRQCSLLSIYCAVCLCLYVTACSQCWCVENDRSLLLVQTSWWKDLVTSFVQGFSFSAKQNVYREQSFEICACFSDWCLLVVFESIEMFFAFGRHIGRIMLDGRKMHKFQVSNKDAWIFFFFDK